MKDELKVVGNAKNQIEDVIKNVEKVIKNNPEASNYKPHKIL